MTLDETTKEKVWKKMRRPNPEAWDILCPEVGERSSSRPRGLRSEEQQRVREIQRLQVLTAEDQGCLGGESHQPRQMLLGRPEGLGLRNGRWVFPRNGYRCNTYFKVKKKNLSEKIQGHRVMSNRARM